MEEKEEELGRVLEETRSARPRNLAVFHKPRRPDVFHTGMIYGYPLAEAYPFYFLQARPLLGDTF